MHAVAGRWRFPDEAGGNCRNARTLAEHEAGAAGCRSTRSSSSRRQVSTHLSMIAFILGIWTPMSTISMPASLSTMSNRPGNLPSRSRIRNRARLPASPRSMMRFFAAWAIQDAVGRSVAPGIGIRRLACSMTAMCRFVSGPGAEGRHRPTSGDHRSCPPLSRTTAGRPALNGPGRSGGARQRSRAGAPGESAAGVAPAADRRTVREPLGSHGSHRPAVRLDAQPPVSEQVRVPASRGRQQFPRLLLPAA